MTAAGSWTTHVTSLIWKYLKLSNCCKHTNYITQTTLHPSKGRFMGEAKGPPFPLQNSVVSTIPKAIAIIIKYLKYLYNMKDIMHS